MDPPGVAAFDKKALKLLKSRRASGKMDLMDYFFASVVESLGLCSFCFEVVSVDCFIAGHPLALVCSAAPEQQELFTCCAAQADFSVQAPAFSDLADAWSPA
jgi:hypothetical protein